MKKSFFHPLLALLLAASTTSCATSGYWIPPSSPVTLEPTALFAQISTDPDSSGSNPGGAVYAQVDDPRLITPDDPVASIAPATALPATPLPVTALPATATQVEPTATNTPAATEPGAITGPLSAPQATLTPGTPPVNTTPFLYYAQAADTLPVVAVRFGVKTSDITSTEPLPATDFLKPGQLLIIPRKLLNTTSPQHLLPDSEVVFSPSTVDFDVDKYVKQAGGYLSTYQEWLKTGGSLSGADIVLRVATENSINPRLLLALMEYQSGWVNGQPATQSEKTYPLGKVDLSQKGLYHQLVWAVNQLSIGYYAYREGRMTEINFPDGVTARMAPDLNAGSAALQYYFAQLTEGDQWLKDLDPDNGFPALYAKMYGNPWQRALSVEPLYPPGITQPPLILPIQKNWTWSFTGGPHGAWEHDGAYAALDFAPGSTESGCVKSNAWALAAASGLVVRSDNGLVVVDLDGDGHEQTGWVIVYLHVSTEGRIPVGSFVDTGQPLGHPSCEGGISTGTHLHIARKYNGEWVPADGPLPFDLGGWIAHYGGLAYKGSLTRNGQTVIACTCSAASSFVTRGEDDP